MTRRTEAEREKAEELDRLIGDPPHASMGAESPAGAQDVARLSALAALVRSELSPARPGETARRRVQAHFLQELRASRPSPRPMPGLAFFKPARAIAGLLLVILFSSATGVAYASAASLPGDPLYPFKRGVEQAQLTASLTAKGDARLTESFADRRLAEIEALAGLGRWGDVERALQAYPSVVDDLVALSGADSSEGEEARLSRHLEVLERVRQKVPPMAQSALEQALERAGHGRDEVEKLQNEKGPRHPPGQEKKR